MEQAMLEPETLSPSEINSFMQKVQVSLVSNPEVIKQYLDQLSPETNPQMWLWMVDLQLKYFHAAVMDKYKPLNPMVALQQSRAIMLQTISKLNKEMEPRWYSKVGEVANSYVDLLLVLQAPIKGISILAKLLNKVQDSPSQYTTVHAPYSYLCYSA